MAGKRDVALIGAGFIAPVHLTALKTIKSLRISAIVDPNSQRAESLARHAGGAQVFSSVEELLAKASPDAAHVLTPPPLHAAAATPLLTAGVHVLLEKPMAQDKAECEALKAAAHEGKASLTVNHNFLHHPDFMRARDLLLSGKYGLLRHVQMRYAVPLRQLTARQFGHWMFNCTKNLLLEQAVHPLSQIDALLGPVKRCKVLAGPVREPDKGIRVVTEYALSLECERGSAQLQIVLGACFPSWTLSLLCDDGVIEADLSACQVNARRPHASIPSIDNAIRNAGQAIRAAGAAINGVSGFAREILRLGPPSDGFMRSQGVAIRAFHDRLDHGEAFVDESGSRLVSLCEEVASSIAACAAKTPATPSKDIRYDVAVLGGTGFIGSHLVGALRARGKRVAVMARSIENLPDRFHGDGVGLFQGSISDPEKVRVVISQSDAVVNLAHGGGGATRQAIAENMIGGARTVAEVARESGCGQLIFVSSSAALYLGDPGETIDMQSLPDPDPEARADYARAKILAERAVQEIDGLAPCILRPAIVVGAGTSPFHSALGAYENTTHCMGWDAGRTPLPFVLVEDVVSAILACLSADKALLAGKALNIVGDVRWTARQYTHSLAKATARPLKFHPRSIHMIMMSEWAKWLAKRIAGRPGLLRPSIRDFRSRGMTAQIDASSEKTLLGWAPCSDEQAFYERAILPHAEASRSGWDDILSAE